MAYMLTQLVRHWRTHHPFRLIKLFYNFAEKPAGIDPRYDHVLEAAKSNRVPDKERTQYFRAMLSEYDKQDIGEAYYEEGFEEGMEKGASQRNIVIAKAMLADSMDPAVVSKYTGLTMEEIEAL